ncbi:MAG: hypothetical protein ACP5SD_02855 [Elusimicrobiales bacterium]|nr:hypothetical protein [Elusimicrobiales bacterium]HOL62422.1 hypothetical protein [Elusimicrobiales bacterium]HPO94386.1 hypothetical protein [Elusimicrobiales bacterium]
MSIWSNAFKINNGRDLTEPEKEIIIKAVEKIKKRKLEDIALMFAESTRPIHTLTSNLIYFAQPTLGFIFSKDEMQKISEILENPKGLEFFREKLKEEVK